MNCVLKLEQVGVELADQPILSGIDLQLNKGEILGLVGPSGCGKTTLLNTLAGFVSLVKGRISIANNIEISPEYNIAPEHRQIGMIFQDYALFPHLTVKENIQFGLRRVSKDETKKRTSRFIELLKLSEYQDRYPHQLSGGQQQRVAIARALAPQPKLLLLDEPFSNIDARLRQELMHEIRDLLKGLGISAVFVTHNKDEVFSFADKMAVMQNGQLLQIGTPAQLCQQPNSWQVADFLQLGSWLPYKQKDNKLETALMTQIYPTTFTSGKILIKPKYIQLVENVSEAVAIAPNVEIENVGVTEQGFHYFVKSLTADPSLMFERFSFYSETLLSLGQQISLKIEPHDYLCFQ